MFPGLDRDLAAAGAVPVRVAAELCAELPGFDPFPRRDFGRVLYTASRPLLEHTVRRRVLAQRNVVIRERCLVLELMPAADWRRMKRSSTSAQRRITVLLIVKSSSELIGRPFWPWRPRREFD